jgi:hypothetical protein
MRKTSKTISKNASASKSDRRTPGYKGEHVRASRKGKVHELFDTQGPEAAWTLGLKLRLKQGTLRSWFGAWHRADNKGRRAKVITGTTTSVDKVPRPAQPDATISAP